MKSSYLSVGVCLLVIFSCLLVTAGVAQAAVYLVDRGLPTYGVYAVTGTGDVDWANRTNIGNGNYDSKDPIWAANPSWGAPELSGDDFTLPVGNLGTADPNFHVTDIRMWIRGSATTSFSQEFNNISLMVGPKGGPLTDLNLTPTVTAVHYPNGQSPSSVLWQLDYAVNLTGTSGQQFSYAIVPNGKASGGAQGYGEAYYMAFMDAVMTAAQTGHNPSGDGYVGDFFTDGTFCDTFTFPAVWGGVRAGDFDVQVLGTHSGTTYQWNDGPGRNGTFNWTDTTNWTPGTGFPNGMDDVANINAGILTMDLGGQAITVGTMNITGFWQWQTGLVNLRNGTLIFQTSGGNATLTDTINPWSTNDTISANVQLASPLTVSMPEYTQGGVGSNALKFTGVVSGNNGITKTGPGTLWLSNAANSFTGDIRVQDGALEVDNWAALPAANTIYLGGVGTVGRLYITDTATITRPLVLTGAGGGLFVNTWTGQGWTGSGQPAAASLNGVISGTGNLFIGMGYATTFNGTADNTYVGDTKVNGWANVLTTARALKGNVAITPGGMVNLASANNLDSTASVYVGSFQMGSAVDSTYGVLTVTGDFVPTIDPRSSGVLSLAANLPGQQYGTGITGTNINAALAVGAPQLGNGMMSIGCVAAPGMQMGEVFTGASLQPDIDHTFRFYIQGAGFTLDSGGAGVLTDVGGVPTSVVVSGPANTWGTTGMSTNNANTFSGSLSINPDMTFQGNAQGTGSAFGAATGDVNLNGGILQLSSGITTPTMVTKNNLNLQGQTALIFWTAGSNCLDKMTMTNIVRNNNAILSVSPNWGGTSGVLGTGGNVSLLVTNPPANQNNGTMAPAWIVRYGGEGFLKYDATNGFVDATFTATDGFGANNGTDIVNLTGNTTVAAGTNVWAVRANGALTGGDITIAGGGLILNGSGTSGHNLVSSSNINFGSSEGVIYSSGHGTGGNWWYAGFNELTGTITSSNGLTFGGPYYGNGGTYIYLSGDNSATLTGPITINMGIVEINSPKALGPTDAAHANTIYLNGGSGNNGNCAVGALAVNKPNGVNYGDNLPLNNPIVVGPNGGTILCEYTQGYVSLYGQISGPGSLTVSGHPGDPVYLYNTSTTAPNNWTGGTYINNSRIDIEPGSRIGDGPVYITASSLYILDPAGTNGTNNIALYQTWGYSDGSMLNVAPATATIGTLEGNGRVMLNSSQWNSNTTLTLGNSGSSDFYGIIQDVWRDQIGSIVKQGTGTFTLWGEGTYRGSTTVNAGTFAVNGAIAGSGVTVNSGGTLAGSGLVNSGVVVTGTGGVGGNLSGSLTINGTLRSINSGLVNMTGGTVNGAVNVGYGPGVTTPGTFSGTGNTINGTVNIARNSVFTGSNTINGTVNIGNQSPYGATFSGTNTINALGSYTAFYSGTITGSNIINTGTLWFNVSNYAVCTLSGSNTINGPTVMDSNGSTNWTGSTKAVVTGSNTFNGAVTMYGGSFSGNNKVNGSFSTMPGANAVVAPSVDTLSAGTMTVVGDVTLDHSTKLSFNLASPGTTGSGINDLIDITGNLSLDGTLNVNALSGFGAGTYRLFNYTGTLSGAATLLQGTVPPDFTYTVDTSAAGQVNLDVVTPFIPGDTDHSGGSTLNSLDIDAIYHHFGQAYTTQWKVAKDTNPVGQEDVTYELTQLMHTNYGDANLDRFTDFTDFQVLLDHWQAPGGWAQGDFNGDGVVDFLDFQVLLDYWNPGGWNAGTSQVPEPATLSLLALGGLALLRRSRK